MGEGAIVQEEDLPPWLIELLKMKRVTLETKLLHLFLQTELTLTNGALTDLSGRHVLCYACNDYKRFSLSSYLLSVAISLHDKIERGLERPLQLTSIFEIQSYQGGKRLKLRAQIDNGSADQKTARGKSVDNNCA